MLAHLMSLAAGLALVTGLAPQEPKPVPKIPAKKGPNPVLAPVADAPGLRRVLLIGDSISMGYSLPVREKLAKVANVHRPPVNCGPSTRGVEQLDQWLGAGTWDMIHFNFGLHDLKFVDAAGKSASPDMGRVQIPVDKYAKNLDAMIVRMTKTGAKLVFATTAPVPEKEPARRADGDKEYNAAPSRSWPGTGWRSTT